MNDKSQSDRMNSEMQAQNTNRERGLARNRGYGSSYSSDISPFSYASASPFELMRRFSDDVDRMFSQMGFGSWTEPFSIARSLQPQTMSSTWTPSVDMAVRGNDLVINADLPGMKPEDINIECDENSIILSGQTRSENQNQNQGQGYSYIERRFGSFYRQIPLPQGVNGENAKATFNNGVLEITIPDAARQLTPQRRRIPIEGAQAQGTGTQNTETPNATTSGKASDGNSEYASQAGSQNKNA